MVEDMTIEEPPQKVEGKSDSGVDQEAENLKSSQNDKQALEHTKYFVDISRANIPFGRGVLFPGSIEQVDVTIGLKEESIEDHDDSKPFMLRVIARCNNTEFDALD